MRACGHLGEFPQTPQATEVEGRACRGDRSEQVSQAGGGWGPPQVERPLVILLSGAEGKGGFHEEQGLCSR